MAWPRERWLRFVLLLSCGASMLLSPRLWLSDRSYPLFPIAPWFPTPPPKWDVVVFGAVLVCLIVAFWRYRTGVIAFLLGSFFLALGDQTRWQPWFYMYWVMLLLTLADSATAIIGCRIVLSTVYFWAGVQKLNPEFFRHVAPWFVEPAGAWLPSGLVSALRWAVAAAPLFEIFIALALWPARTRRAALLAVWVVHAVSLVFLGPAGHKLNWIIWPWNLAMPALAWVLFPLRTPIEQTLGRPKRPWAIAALLPFVILPALSFFGRWDSYLSFALYSGNQATADLFVSANVRERLPAEVQHFVPATPPPYNQELQGPYVVRVDLWALHTLNVPPLPEPRSYLHLARYLASFAADPNEVHLVLNPRFGRTLFYRGGDLRPEAGIPLNL